MLNEEEENRVRSYAKTFKEESEKYYLPYMPVFDISIQEAGWVVEKLLELNEEASRYSSELQAANEELARFREFYDA